MCNLKTPSSTLIIKATRLPCRSSWSDWSVLKTKFNLKLTWEGLKPIKCSKNCLSKVTYCVVIKNNNPSSLNFTKYPNRCASDMRPSMTRRSATFVWSRSSHEFLQLNLPLQMQPKATILLSSPLLRWRTNFTYSMITLCSFLQLIQSAKLTPKFLQCEAPKAPTPLWQIAY